MLRVLRLVLAPALLAGAFLVASADTADAHWPARYGSHYGYGYSSYYPGVAAYSPHYSYYYPAYSVRRIYAYPAYRTYSYPAYGYPAYYGGYGVRAYYGGGYCW
jgi:hypothetical protein